MTGTVDRFLEAEEEAARLVEALRLLKAETESYHTSRMALETAGAGVMRVADDLTTIAQRVDGVIETLRTIGTPELLSAQDEARSEVAELRAELQEARRAMEASASAQGQALEAAIQDIRLATRSGVKAVNGLRGFVLAVGVILLLGLVAVAGLVQFHGSIG